MRRDLAGIDLVVGAKGSPMQLILAGVFHLDVPPGNIPLAALETLAQHPLVARVVPMSLGDSAARLPDRRHHAQTTPHCTPRNSPRAANGRKPLEAVLGSEVAIATGLKTGDSFVGAHGLGASGESARRHALYRRRPLRSAPAPCSTASC